MKLSLPLRVRVVRGTSVEEMHVGLFNLFSFGNIPIKALFVCVCLFISH